MNIYNKNTPQNLENYLNTLETYKITKIPMKHSKITGMTLEAKKKLSKYP